MDPSSFLSKLTDRGDLGIALLSYVAGYAADFWFFPNGMSSGVVAGLAAAGAVGLKNVAQWMLETWRKGNNLYLTEDEIGDQHSKLADYIDHFLKTVSVTRDDPMVKLQRQLAEREFLWRSGITANAEFARYLQLVRVECQKSSQRYLQRSQSSDSEVVE